MDRRCRCSAIILVGFFTDVKLPGGIPVGLAALLVGTAIGWIGGYMSVPDVAGRGQRHRHRACPTLHFDLLVTGLAQPRAAAGHRDPAGRLQLHRGDEQRGERRGGRRQLQPAQRAARRRRRRDHRLGARLARSRPPSTSATRAGRPPAAAASYSLASGVVIALLCFLGLFGAARRAAADPGDRADPALHRPADRRAGVPGGAAGCTPPPWSPRSCPNLASWATGLIDNALAAAGTTAAQVGEEALTNAGLVYHGLHVLGQGAVLAGMVLGAIVAFILERKLFRAAIAAGVGAVLSWIGLIHAEQVAWARPRGRARLRVARAGAARHRRPAAQVARHRAGSRRVRADDR